MSKIVSCLLFWTLERYLLCRLYMSLISTFHFHFQLKEREYSQTQIITTLLPQRKYKYQTSSGLLINFKINKR